MSSKLTPTVRCPDNNCPEKFHSLGTQFCPNTGKPIIKSSKIIIIFSALAVGLTSLFLCDIYFDLGIVYKKNKDVVTAKDEEETKKTAKTTEIEETIQFSNNKVKNAQKILKKLLKYYGPVDGHLNDDTIMALKNFQREYGLEITGKIDMETSDALAEENGIEQAD